MFSFIIFNIISYILGSKDNNFRIDDVINKRMLIEVGKKYLKIIDEPNGGISLVDSSDLATAFIITPDVTSNNFSHHNVVITIDESNLAITFDSKAKDGKIVISKFERGNMDQIFEVSKIGKVEYRFEKEGQALTSNGKTIFLDSQNSQPLDSKKDFTLVSVLEKPIGFPFPFGTFPTNDFSQQNPMTGFGMGNGYFQNGRF